MAVASRNNGSSVDQRLGELIGIVNGLAENIKQLREDNTRQKDKQDAETLRIGVTIGSIREEQIRNITTMQTQIGALVSQVEKMADVTRDIASIKEKVEGLQGPVDRMTGFMTRVISYSTIIAAVGTIFWALFSDVLKAGIGGIFKVGVGH